jgi:nicotinamidase-related amidase
MLFDKRVYSPWYDGSLAPLLIGRGVTTLIVSGLETEVCVLATVLGAIDHGFRVVIAMDAVCSSADETHDAMSRIYESRYGMQVEAAFTPEIIDAWYKE